MKRNNELQFKPELPMVHKSIYVRYLQHWLKNFTIADEEGKNGKAMIKLGQRLVQEGQEQMNRVNGKARAAAVAEAKKKSKGKQVRLPG